MAHFAIGTRPQISWIDVFSLGKSYDQIQHYVGNITQHLLVYIPLGSVIGCGIPLEFGWHSKEEKHTLCEVGVFVLHSGMDNLSGQLHSPGFLVAGEVGELRVVQSTDQWNNCYPRRKSILQFPLAVCRIHRRIHSITLHVYGPGWSIDHVVFIWAFAKEVLRTFNRVSTIEKPLTIGCPDGGVPPVRQLVVHLVDWIVNHLSGGVRTVLSNVASALIEVVTNLWLGILHFNESDGLFTVFGVIKRLPQAFDEN